MDKKTVYVIQKRNITEKDPDSVVIGVSDSSVKAIELLKEYFGEYKQLSFRDIRDCGIEWEMTIESDSVINGKKYVDEVTCLSFNINEL